MNCECNQGMVAIDKEFYKALLMDSGLVVKAATKPSFKPDTTVGDAKPSSGELDYRSSLLLLLGALYSGAKKVVNGKESTSDKITILDKLLQNFTSKAQSLATKHNTGLYAAAITEANKNLQRIRSDLERVTPKTNKLTPLIDQQLANIEDIGYYINGRLRQGLLIGDVDELYDTTHRDEDNYLDGAFTTAQNRLDQTGIYGALNARKYGLLETYIAAEIILGVVLVSDWLTCEDPDHSTGCMSDGLVCDDCLDMAAGGPYPVIAFPGEVHFGDRCEPGPPYIRD